MKGHPFIGAISGFFFGLSLSLLLLTLGVLATDSVVLGALPFVFLIVGIILAAVAPFRRSRLQPAGAAPAAAPVPDAAPATVDPPAAEPPAGS